MPTDQFSVTADADDDNATRHDTVWATVQAGGGTFVDGAGATLTSLTKQLFFSEYYVGCPVFRFDTSALDNGATVTAADLVLELLDKDDADDIQYAGDFYDFGGSPAVAADWELISTADAIATIDPDSYSVGIVTIPLTGLSGISLTGYTGIRLAPKTNTAPAGSNYMDFATREHLTAQAPRLDVTYSLAAVTDEEPLRQGRSPLMWRS